MSYFSEWQNKIEDSSDKNEYQLFVQHYYELETVAYEKILNDYPQVVCGQAGEIADRLGFGKDMVVFLGFLDGINASLVCENDLESITDESNIELNIDFAKLYLNMHEAKADWLYGLKAWSNVFDQAHRDMIAKEYRQSKIAISHKVGRNDSCPCGSGKKYKNCCGKN
jgi:hypothetical protein